MDAPPADAAQLLRTYVNDHRAAAAGGAALARRCRDRNAGTALGTLLDDIVREIDEDAAALDRFAQEHGIRANPIKELGARLAERMGRLKLNGRLRGPSPLGTVLELEALMAGIDAKRSLWRSLDACTSGRASSLDVAALVRRATDQRERLQGHHATAARRAFPTISSAAPTSPSSAATPA